MLPALGGARSQFAGNGQETIRATAIDNLAFRQACTPGYYNGEGRAGEGQGIFDGLYGPGSDAFFALMKTWREAGDMRGLEVR